MSLASGRTPVTDLLKLENCGVALAKGGYIVVDQKEATNVPGIFAIGE